MLKHVSWCRQNVYKKFEGRKIGRSVKTVNLSVSCRAYYVIICVFTCAQSYKRILQSVEYYVL